MGTTCAMSVGSVERRSTRPLVGGSILQNAPITPTLGGRLRRRWRRLRIWYQANFGLYMLDEWERLLVHVCAAVITSLVLYGWGIAARRVAHHLYSVAFPTPPPPPPVESWATIFQ